MAAYKIILKDSISKSKDQEVFKYEILDSNSNWPKIGYGDVYNIFPVKWGNENVYAVTWKDKSIIIRGIVGLESEQILYIEFANSQLDYKDVYKLFW